MYNLTTKLTALALFAALALFPTTKLLAGSLDSPAEPTDTDSAMFTLEDIYNRLHSGTEGTKRGAAFVEPAEGPASTGKTLNDVMDKAPKVDDTDGATADEVKEGKKFWGLSSGEWGIQTGTLEAGGGAGIFKTGQTTCWNATGTEIDCNGTGQDGELQQGVAWPNPRFTVNGDGTVTDNMTGLVWLRNAHCAEANTNWTYALSYITSLNTDGTMNGRNCGDTSNGGTHQTDWRLPNVLELQSLIAWGYSEPALANTAGTAKWTENDPFTNVIWLNFHEFWSSTTDAGNTTRAWYVSSRRGDTGPLLKTQARRVWPVRAGQ